VEADAEVLCSEQQDEHNSTNLQNNCWLYVKHEIGPHALGFFTVQYNADSGAVAPITQKDTLSIESEELKLTWLPHYSANGTYFSLLDKQTGENKTLGLDMRFYRSYQGKDKSDHQSSGTYIFKQDGNESHPYGELKSVSISRG
jgi:hypothetical protein